MSLLSLSLPKSYLVAMIKLGCFPSLCQWEVNKSSLQAESFCACSQPKRKRSWELKWFCKRETESPASSLGDKVCSLSLLFRGHMSRDEKMKHTWTSKMSRSIRMCSHHGLDVLPSALVLLKVWIFCQLHTLILLCPAAPSGLLCWFVPFRPWELWAPLLTAERIWFCYLKISHFSLKCTKIC